MAGALFRLAGDGDRGPGGAVPLADAFNAVIEELMDENYATTEYLGTLISDRMKFCELNIMTAAWRSWDQFSEDILECLSDEMHLIAKNSSGKWTLTREFVPDFPFPLPGLSKVIIRGRSKPLRKARVHNSKVLQALHPVMELLRGEAVEAEPLVKQLLFEAERVLLRELKEPEPEPPTRYRQNNPRPPHEQGKRIRVGLTRFFREEFWVKYAKPGEWYALTDVAEVFNQTHPDQPPINHADLTGSMRKQGRDMVRERILESKKVPENGVLKWKFRKKVSHPGYGANAAVVEVEVDPKSMKWEAPNDPDARSINSYLEEAELLRGNPGHWGLIATFPIRDDPVKDASPARNIAYDINRGRYIAFRPRGSFRATSRMTVDDEGKRIVKVHARYIGENGEYRDVVDT